MAVFNETWKLFKTLLQTVELETNKEIWSVTSSAGVPKQVAFTAPGRRESLLIPD